MKPERSVVLLLDDSQESAIVEELFRDWHIRRHTVIRGTEQASWIPSVPRPVLLVFGQVYSGIERVKWAYFYDRTFGQVAR